MSDKSGKVIVLYPLKAGIKTPQFNQSLNKAGKKSKDLVVRR